MKLNNLIKNFLLLLINNTNSNFGSFIINFTIDTRYNLGIYLFKNINKKFALKINRIKRFELFTLKDLKPYLKYEIKSEKYETLNLPKVWGISQGGKISVWTKSINLYEFTNAQFVAYSDFIRVGAQVYWDKLDSFQLTKTIPADKDLVIDNRDKGFVHLISPKKELMFETVFSLCGVHVNSWGHFVGNFLSKIATIKDINNNEIIIIMPKDVDEHIKNITFDFLKEIGNFKLNLLAEMK
jgi:hypothetical protein